VKCAARRWDPPPDERRGCMFNVAIMCVYGTRTVADEPHVYNTWARLRGHSGDRTATGDLRLSTPHDPRSTWDRQRHSIYNVIVATSTVRPPLPLAPFCQ